MNRSKSLLCLVGIFLFISFVSSCNFSMKKKMPYDMCFEGQTNVSSSTPFVITGKGIAVVGTQDAFFSANSLYEMSGVWIDSTKLINGMRMKVSDGINNKEELLKAAEIQIYPHYIRFNYPDILGGIKVYSMMFASDNESGIIHKYFIKNETERNRAVNLEFIVETNLTNGSVDSSFKQIHGGDVMEWDNEGKIFTVENLTSNCYVACGADYRIASFSTGKALVNEQNSTTTASLYSQMRIKNNEMKEITYALTGSTRFMEDAKNSYVRLMKNENKEWGEKEKNIYNRLCQLQSDNKKTVLDKSYYWKAISDIWQEETPDCIKPQIELLIKEMIKDF